MKNRLFIKIGTIAVLLFSIVLFMDSNPTNTLDNVYAGTGSSKVQLKINEGAITCTGWYGILNMGAINAAFGATTLSGNYTSNSWKCTDTKGSLNRGFTIRITGDLVGPSTYTISSGQAFICTTTSLVKLQGTTASPSLGTTIPACPTSTGLVVTQDIMRRTNTNGQIYEYASTPRIGVNIPASQSPGTYTGTLELSIP